MLTKNLMIIILGLGIPMGCIQGPAGPAGPEGSKGKDGVVGISPRKDSIVIDLTNLWLFHHSHLPSNFFRMESVHGGGSNSSVKTFETSSRSEAGEIKSVLDRYCQGEPDGTAPMSGG